MTIYIYICACVLLHTTTTPKCIPTLASDTGRNMCWCTQTRRGCENESSGELFGNSSRDVLSLVTRHHSSRSSLYSCCILKKRSCGFHGKSVAVQRDESVLLDGLVDWSSLELSSSNEARRLNNASKVWVAVLIFETFHTKNCR